MALVEHLSIMRQIVTSVKATNHKNAVSKTALPPYKSKLAEFARKAEEPNKQAVSSDSIRFAKEAWENAIRASDYSILTRKDVRILSTQAKMVQDSRFLEFLESKEGDISGRIVRVLLPTAHSIWNKHPGQSGLAEILRKALRSYEGRNRALLCWQHHATTLLSDSGPKVIAAGMTEASLSIDSILSSYHLDSRTTPFAEEVSEHAVEIQTGRILRDQEYDSLKWDYLFGQLIVAESVTKNCRDKNLAALIEICHHKRWNQAREIVKDFSLKSTDLGDPRLHPARWQSVSEQARDIVILWLSEEEIRIFFDLLFSYDPHGRKDFWLRYVGRLKSTRVVVCPDDHSKHYYEFKKLTEKGRSFANGFGSDASAFILDFGEYVAIEYAKTGNACFVYSSSDFRRKFPTIYISQFDLTGLKKLPARDSYKQSHHSNWQNQLRNYLAERGIRGKFGG
jgi:hypothetical protein